MDILNIVGRVHLPPNKHDAYGHAYYGSAARVKLHGPLHLTAIMRPRRLAAIHSHVAASAAPAAGAKQL